MMIRPIKRYILFVFFIIAAVFIVIGCAEKSKELLAEDYKKNNENLLRY
jgi:hypothetical protein